MDSTKQPALAPASPAQRPSTRLQVGLILVGMVSVLGCFVAMIAAMQASRIGAALDASFGRREYVYGMTCENAGIPWLRAATTLLAWATVATTFNLWLHLSRQKRAIFTAKLTCGLEALAALMLLMGMDLGRADKYLVIALLVHAAIGYVLYDENKAVKALLCR
jgi:hypothetical protein